MKKIRKPDPTTGSHFRVGPVTANRNITCGNCGTNHTVLWRKGPDGCSQLCNPCGLFYKLHGTHRSPEKKKEIHRRNRAGKKRFSISTLNSSSSEDADDEDVESPVTTEFGFRHHPANGGVREQIQVKSEQREYAPPSPEWLEHPQYQYQWQGGALSGRAC